MRVGRKKLILASMLVLMGACAGLAKFKSFDSVVISGKTLYVGMTASELTNTFGFPDETKSHMDIIHRTKDLVRYSEWIYKRDGKEFHFFIDDKGIVTSIAVPKD